jgi:large subunit ribosomal protein L35Ae
LGFIHGSGCGFYDKARLWFDFLLQHDFSYLKCFLSFLLTVHRLSSLSSSQQLLFSVGYIIMGKAEQQNSRLYVSGAILGYKRGQRNQYNHTSLIKIKGVDLKADTEFYMGKRIAYITKASTPDRFGNKFRITWGKVVRAHGSNGVVRCKFKRDLPPQSIGGRVRVMLYPSRV